MNVQQYLQKKMELTKTSTDTVAPTQRCLSCFRSSKACLCHAVQSFDTKTKFIILMHPKEAKKERTGTGRLTHLSLKNSRIVIGENFDQHEEIQQILADQNLNCFLLYPGSSSQNLDIGAPMQMQNAEAQKKINVIFVIDGTWSCAKSMMRDSLTLHGLPRVSFNSDKKSNFAIKQQPNSYCLSSIESIFYVLDALNRFKIEDIKNSEHKNLLILLDKMCEFQVACTQLPDSRRYRPGNYKRSHEKRVSKKWVKRKVYFE